jgi:hypothetical protein
MDDTTKITGRTVWQATVWRATSSRATPYLVPNTGPTADSPGVRPTKVGNTVMAGMIRLIPNSTSILDWETAKTTRLLKIT